MLKNILDKFLKKQVFPLNYTCNACDKEIFNGDYFCNQCKNEIFQISKNKCNHCGRKTPYFVEYCQSCSLKNLEFNFARSVYDYSGIIPKLIQYLKYEGKLHLADIFAEKLKDIYFNEFFSCDVVIGVPMTKSANRKRGYNQSYVLAKKLAKLINVEYSEKIVEKVKESERQATLDVNERLKNLKGCFKVNKKVLNNRDVLIVDDVLTTGTTCNYISELLHKNGAKNVYVLTIASVQKD